MAADDLTAALEEIRGRDVAGIRGHPWIEDVPRLLAAIEAVLKLTDPWIPKPSPLPPTPREAAAIAIRETISRSLSGKEESE